VETGVHLPRQAWDKHKAQADRSNHFEINALSFFGIDLRNTTNVKSGLAEDYLLFLSTEISSGAETCPFALSFCSSRACLDKSSFKLKDIPITINEKCDANKPHCCCREWSPAAAAAHLEHHALR
jgi:hypothetical protein